MRDDHIGSNLCNGPQSDRTKETTKRLVPGFPLAALVKCIEERARDVIVKQSNAGADHRQAAEPGEPAIAGDFGPHGNEGVKACEDLVAAPCVDLSGGSVGVDAPCSGLVAQRLEGQGQAIFGGQLVIVLDFARTDRASVVIKYTCFAHTDQIVSGLGPPRGCDIKIIENALTDRGSKYAVTGGPVGSADEAKAFVKQLCRKKKFAKATHNTWAVLLPDGPLKNDDGESGAGMVILRMLEREDLQGHIIVVTRWFGGTKLGGDRFRRVQDAVRIYLDAR